MFRAALSFLPWIRSLLKMKTPLRWQLTPPDARRWFLENQTATVTLGLTPNPFLHRPMTTFKAPFFVGYFNFGLTTKSIRIVLRACQKQFKAPPSPKPSSLLGKVKNKILKKRASSPKIKAEPLDKIKEAKTEEGEEHSKPCPDSKDRDELA